MKILNQHFKLLLVFWSPIFFHAADVVAAAMKGAAEVVQSVPVETTLQVPGIRFTQQVWVEMISSAQKTIDLEQFYIHHQLGQSLEPVLNALIAAASRGVKIRFLVDIQFFKNYPDVPKQLSVLPNVQVKTIDFSAYGGIQHAKFFIVDQSRSFLGSANFDWLALSHIHEVGLKMEDAQIGNGLEAIFAKDWAAGTVVGGVKASFEKDLSGKKIRPVNGLKLIASPSTDLPPYISPSLDAITSVLASAKSTIKIQVYQYSTKGGKSPWLLLDNTIRSAAARGVQVKLLVDAVALKNSAAELKSLAGVKNIQVRSVVIPEWSGGPIAYARLVHSKYFTVDGFSSWVGTENWSESYFSGCRNVGIILQNKNLTSQLDQIHDQVWNSAYTNIIQ